MEELYNAYRPLDFDTLVGQDHIVKSIESFKELPHAFLLYGPSGVGKSTVAKILARRLGCEEEPYLIVINGSDKNGVDDMRQLVDTLRYGGNPNKVIIIEEAQKITTNAWDCLLDPIEHLPSHAYVILTTTEPKKMPDTAFSRCQPYQFKELKMNDILVILTLIDEMEDWGLHEYLDIIADKALGSMRQAISYLSICRGCKSKKEVKELLDLPISEEPIWQLINLIKRGGSWPEAYSILEKLRDGNPEYVRIILNNSLVKELGKQTDKRKIIYILKILNEFSEPFTGSTAFSSLCIATGYSLLGGQ